MQSTGPNANRAPIICLLESSLLECDTSNRPCLTYNSNINRSNSIFYTSYDALLLMQSAIYNLQELESKPFNIEPSITSLALVRVHWLYPSRHFYEGHANLTTDTNSFLTHPQPGFPVAETVDLACSNNQFIVISFDCRLYELKRFPTARNILAFRYRERVDLVIASSLQCVSTCKKRRRRWR